ncbi:ATP-binding protein [Streptomyces ochraceiscleroticus]|uniref:ATP-binding protein n=1 Tax=Streptomyces ochraceiscleroticus TaxID=47761 RepID=A0ABW1MG06_9ACTN|nr:ATP-binding protein [Streptomyces ochraceiscleroticus]
MTDGTPQDIEWRLPRSARSVGRARTLLAAQARSWKVPDEIADTAVLLLSELMTNACRHAHVSPGRELRARALVRAGTLCIEVADASSAQPEPRVAGPGDESGRGLALVAALADAWGAEPRPYRIGKTVWCELRLPSDDVRSGGGPLPSGSARDGSRAGACGGPPRRGTPPS